MKLASPWTFLVTLFGATLALLLTGCQTTREQTLQRFEFKRLEMGMMFTMQFYASDKQMAEPAAIAAFDRIRELNMILSDYEDDSELNRVRHSSGSGRWIGLSSELWTVMREADRFSQETDGAFDITAGPLIQLWKRARRQRALPAEERLAEARTRVGHYYIEFRNSGRSVVLWRKGMRLDLGGVAKGYAMDEAVKVLERHGIRRALINGGGDMVASGPPPDAPAWKIELPRLDTNAAPQFVALRNAAFATSGDRFQFVSIDGVRYSHIVDPRSGEALSDRALVYVIAPSGMIADALATSASVLDKNKALQLTVRRNCALRVTRVFAGQRTKAESTNFKAHLWKN
ncbi:MAG: hypothetical protein CMO80_09485 [Verrucomicrobiales bacterium]|nr:hypothetical protein [Verrucomicrobiales bacterium]